MKTFAVIAALGAVVVLGGCALTKKADEPKVLRLAPTFAAAGAVQPGSLSVSAVMAGGVAGERRYAYVDRAAPTELKQAASLFWEEPPPRIVERALVAGLRTRIATVVGPETSIPTDKRASVRLERFEEESAAGVDAQARVAIDVTVLSVADRKVLLTGRYCATSAIGGTTSSDRARAFETAVKQVVEALGQDLVRGAARSAGC